MITQPTTANDLHQYIDGLIDREVNENTFHLRKTTLGEVLCAGPDQLPARFIKLVVEQLAGPLTVIINSCIDRFPRLWKMARISPIPKTDHYPKKKIN